MMEERKEKGRMMKNRALRPCPFYFSAVKSFSSRSTDSTPAPDMEIDGPRNAYEILRVSPTCSQDCIRDAFRRLAKLTHPDMQSGVGNPNPSSVEFILVRSAYQILSDPEKRVKYDAYLQARSRIGRKQTQTRGECSPEVRRNVNIVFRDEDEDVSEWLRWYRDAAMRMVHEDQIGTCNRFHDEFKSSLQEALRRCYFGPDISIASLPNCFEAEERADITESEVLHLVSGHNLFGVVVQKDEPPLLKGAANLSVLDRSQCTQSLQPFLVRNNSTMSQNRETTSGKHVERKPSGYNGQIGFVELELYLHGKRVARATRKHSSDAVSYHNKRNDVISVYLCLDQSAEKQGFNSANNNADLLLGTIVGLDTTENGGKGKVYSPEGEHTHIIWQFRTPWVKHLHWFKITGKQMLCECRSSRARLPPSKFWVFRARSQTHNIGGWYIETICRNSAVDDANSSEWAGKHLGLLHPALYIFGTAYKTLDTELMNRRTDSLWCRVWEKQTLITAALKLFKRFKASI